MGDSVLSLGTVAGLLEDQARSLSDVYTLYGFKDDHSFSDYVAFFLHEPVAWFEGLPGSFKSKASFAKPKIALSKALKHGDVIAVLGAETCERAVAVLWNTYKKEADRIVAARNSGTVIEGEAPAVVVNEVHTVAEMEEPESRPLRQSRKKAKAAGEPPAASQAMSYEVKYRVVDRALRAMLSDVTAQNEAMLVFLDALKDA